MNHLGVYFVSRRRMAFTLIELLVVISIIALLVAILLPALGQARATAVMLQCLTQTRSIGQATHMYQADHTQYYGYGLDSSGMTNNYYHNGTYNTYLGLGESYTNDTLPAEQWHCPAVWDESVAARGTLEWTFYTANANLMGWISDTNGYHSTSYAPASTGFQNIKESDIKEPASNTAMWQEGYLPRGWITPTTNSIRTNGGAHFLAPHFSKSNYTWGGQLGHNPTHPDEVAGGGKCSVTFMDGGGGNFVALDFPGGSGNASYQLDR